MEKVFYWIKLRIDFFSSPEMKLLSSLENGADYILFWIKLLLLAVKEVEPGILRYNENLPYMPEMLAAVMDTNIDIVRAALTYFQKFGMIEMQDNGDILIPSAPALVGSETTAAIRKRRQREKEQIEAHDIKELEYNRDNVTSMSQNGHT